MKGYFGYESEFRVGQTYIKLGQYHQASASMYFSMLRFTISKRLSIASNRNADET